MTRSSLKRTLRRAYWILGLVLVVSIVAKLADHIPGLAGTAVERLLKDIYDYLKDMSLVLVTVVAAYLANVFQKRSLFLNALKEEWRNIVKAKSTLYTYTQLDSPSQEQYLAAFCAISESLDNMGEDPQVGARRTADERDLVRDSIMQSFYALRETFLEEMDLEAPDNPLLIYNGRRIKKPGAPGWATRSQDRQAKKHDRISPADPRLAAFLTKLYEKEQVTAKPWREVAAKANGATNPPPPADGSRGDGAPVA